MLVALLEQGRFWFSFVMLVCGWYAFLDTVEGLDAFSPLAKGSCLVVDGRAIKRVEWVCVLECASRLISGPTMEG